MASFYDELIDLLLEGKPISAIKRVREGTDISLLDAKRWVEEFSMKVVGPIAAGKQPRSRPVVVGIPGVMSGQPCIGGTRILAATIADYLSTGSTDEEVHADYPTLPPGSCDAVWRWRVENSRLLSFSLHDHQMQRDPGESDAAFAARLALFEQVRDAVGSAAIEGQEISVELRALLQQYVDGKITIEQVMMAVQRMYGPKNGTPP